MLKYFLPAALLSLFIGTLNAQNIFDLKNSLKFANYLSKTQQFELAAHEYERIHFMVPRDDSIKLLLVLSYRLAGNFNKSLTTNERFNSDLANMHESFAREYIKSLILTKSYEKAGFFLQNNQDMQDFDKLIMQLNISLLDRNWSHANETLKNSTIEKTSLLMEYEMVINNSLNLKHRSPALAMSLSTIIPGMGKVYANDWVDGFVSLLLISSAGYQSYSGFKNKGVESVYGWIYGGLAFGFYTGNIYGSYKSAKIFNKKQEDSIIREVENIIHRNF
ncbi:MAG: hypothetical protein IIA45_14240 [Bacteroidetes bacterium]|nr:hypothetical protein [Bacteroidota bacterium]